MILERIEESYGHLEPVNLAVAKLTIEHIMPQTLSEQWINELAAGGDDPTTTQDELVHTLGNLTLTAYNGVLSNNPFERKRDLWIPLAGAAPRFSPEQANSQFAQRR